MGRFTFYEAGPALKSSGAQGRFELAKVFGKFRGPRHARARLAWMFEGEDFGVQGLSRESDARARALRSPTIWIVSAVSHQRKSGMGSLSANLMFSASFQTQPQFGNETRAAGDRVFGHDFVVGDGFARVWPGGPGLPFGKDLLMQFVPAQ